MTMDVLVNFALVMLFVLIGGVFSGTEMAIVSLRESQIEQIETEGEKGEKIGRLVRNPNMFLSAVQIGVTLAGFFSSAYGAQTLAPALAPVLVSIGMPAEPADTTAFILMTIFIAYLSLVFGELVPKRMGMQNSVSMTRVVAPPLGAFSNLMRPVIWLLSKSTNAVVRLLGGDPNANDEAVSVEEIRSMVKSSDQIEASHRAILTDVFDAAERTVVEVMKPRTETDFLEGEATIAEALDVVRDLPHSRYPVFGEDVDDIIGFVHLRDLISVRDHRDLTVSSIVRDITMYPGTVQVLQALNEMRGRNDQIAIVVDEYGGTAGLVTMEDLLEEVVGDIYDEYDRGPMDPEDSVLHEAHHFEVEGGLILQEFRDQTGLELPDNGTYQTVGGFIMARLGRVAEVGDPVSMNGFVLTVSSMDGRRISRVLVTRAKDALDPTNAGATAASQAAAAESSPAAARD
ncbi:hemolysin family protein [Nigerium massiliense]|uniref:hemolysin family protein n=1 Tax=Nigerium massiliense TaxID=1522317 RepID=UPI0006939D10|nr:hemolysin family protein [Nigerium massiliense]